MPLSNRKNNMRVCVSGGSRSGKDPIYEQAAYTLGKTIAKMGFRLDYGLSDVGIMGAVARGVLENWEAKKDKYYKEEGPIVGITTPQYYELYEKNDILKQISKVVLTTTLEDRKIQLLEADLVVFAPGGVGTLDELSYDCVAMQDGFLKTKPFIVYNVNGFFYHILEYLKVIASSGFADPIPFIVVDNEEELEIAFRLLREKYNECANSKEAYANARQLAYEMPYFIKRKSEDNNIYIETIMEEMENIRNNGTEEQQTELNNQIEQAYLEKETERMFERLNKAIGDTSVISKKLSTLKKRKKVSI